MLDHYDLISKLVLGNSAIDNLWNTLHTFLGLRAVIFHVSQRLW